MSGLIGSPRHGNLGSAAPPFYEYEIDYACRFNDDDSAALDVAAAPAMDDAKTYSLSFWVKRGNLGTLQYIMEGGVDVNNCTRICFSATNKFYWGHVDTGGATDELLSTMVFRDTTNWYHMFILYDSTEAAAADRMRVWVNGTEITAWDNTNNPALNAACDFGGNLLNIACEVDNSDYFDGYFAEMYFIDGTTYTSTDFGEFKNGVWVPIEPSVTYGSAGFYLPFSNSADFGSDQSGNSNDFTDVNLNTNDQVVDTPTNNYCVINTLDKGVGGNVLSNGNLDMVASVSDNARAIFKIPSTGKWYFECQRTAGAFGGMGIMAGQDDVDTDDTNMETSVFVSGAGYVRTYVFIEGVQKAAYWASGAPGTGDWVGCCVDMDNGNISWTNDADGQGAEYAFTQTNRDYFAFCGGAAADAFQYHFGQQGSWNTAPPSIYIALNTTNIAATYKYTSDIMNPSKGFNIVTYQGNDGATQAITGADHQPDLVAIKNRSQADSHYWCDSVRGVTKFIELDSSDAEVTDANDGISSFDVDGFTVMFNALDIVNAAGENYVGWCWKEDPIYGFDMVAFTGTGAAHAINHNCGGTPELIVVKCRNVAARNWWVYHHHALIKTDPETDYGTLDVTNAWADGVTLWNDTAPTSTQFTVGTSVQTNENTKLFIAYLWRSIEGFSKIFSYEGNSNADGPFVHCGFRPKFVMIKWADGVGSWYMYDTQRDTYNVMTQYLIADSGIAETPTTAFDFLSNGFKIRTANAGFNSASTFIGIAMAELPGVFSNAR